MSEECEWEARKDFRDDFSRAAAALKVRRPDLRRPDTLKAISAFYSFRKQSHSYDASNGDLVYVPCTNCESERFFQFLRSTAKEKRTSQSFRLQDQQDCTFAFMRDPISRFRSGYLEMETRFQEGLKEYGDEDMVGLTFHEYPIGSVDRIRALLRDLLNLRWYRRSRPFMPMALSHRFALSHVLPAYGSLGGYKFSFVGDADKLETGLEELRRVCPAKVPEGLVSKYAHSSSPDLLGLASAVDGAFQNEDIRAAHAALFRVDFELYEQRYQEA